MRSKLVACVILIASLRYSTIVVGQSLKSRIDSIFFAKTVLTDPNPAVFNLDARSVSGRVSLSILSNSSSAKFQFGRFLPSNVDILRDNILGSKGHVSGYSGMALSAPELYYGLSSNTTLGFRFSTNVIANYNSLDGRLMSEFGEITKLDHAYPYQLDDRLRMKFATALYTDFAISLSQKLVKLDQHSVTIGANVRLLNGVAYSSINAENLDGTVSLSKDNISFLSHSRGGHVATLSSGAYFDHPSFSNFHSIRKLTPAFDLGIVYSFFKRSSAIPSFIVGVSVVDIGYLSFKPDSKYSKSYTVNIDARGLYFNHNFQNTSFSRTTRIFDSYPQFFKADSSKTADIRTSLPLTFRTFTYVQAGKRLGLNFQTIIDLSNNRSFHFSYPTTVALTPTLGVKRFNFSVPISYQRISGLSSGIGIKYRGLSISSLSLLTSLIQSKQSDLSISFRWQ